MKGEREKKRERREVKDKGKNKVKQTSKKKKSTSWHEVRGDAREINMTLFSRQQATQQATATAIAIARATRELPQIAFFGHGKHRGETQRG